MSLRYASRVCLRAAQAAQGLRDPQSSAAAVKNTCASPSPPWPQNRRFTGGLAEVSKKAPLVEEKVKRRRADKSENVVHLICWGPN